MTNTSSRSEADLASERNENLQRGLKAKRLVSILLAGLFFIGAAFLAFLGFAMLVFCLIVLALIFLVRYFDANSQLHEVRRRSTKSLAPHLSVLKREDLPTSSKQGQPLAHG